MRLAYRYRLTALCVALLSFAASSADAPLPGVASGTGTSLQYTGRAHHPTSGEFLYSEINQFSFEAGRIVSALVSYEDAQGAVFARRELDFRRSEFVPDFHTVMLNTGFEEALKRHDNHLELRHRKAHGKKLRSKLIEEPAEAAADNGLVPYILHRLERIRAGEIVVFRFISPAYRGTLKFTAARDADSAIDGRPVTVVRIDIGGLFIGLFTQPLFLSFDAANNSFREYRGLSNLRDPDGDTWPVVIRYPLDGLSLPGR